MNVDELDVAEIIELSELGWLLIDLDEGVESYQDWELYDLLQEDQSY